MIFKPVFSIFTGLHCPLGLAELQVCPFPNVVFSPLPLSALSSSPFHYAVKDGFCHTWWTGNMTIPLQFVSLYDRQQVSVWSNCLLDLGTDFLIGNVIRCVVSCGCTSFSWLVFFYAALLWGSMIHKHTGRWLLLDTTRFWWPLDFASSLEDAEYKRYQVPFHLWFTVSVVFCFLHWLFYVGICA